MPGETVERDGREAGQHSLLPRCAAGLVLDHDDCAQALAVDDELTAAGSAQVLARQADEGGGSDDREVNLAARRLRLARSGQIDGLDPGRRRHGHVRGGNRAVGDVGRRELEDRLRASLGVDPDTQRRAVARVPGELGVAEEAAVVLGRDVHAVRRATGDIGGARGRDVGVCAQLREQAVDVGHRRRRTGAGVWRMCRQVEFVDGIRRGIVDGQRGVVPHHLRVAGVRLQLEPSTPVVGQPQPPRGAGHQRREIGADERARGEEVVREADPCGDARDIRGRERIMEGLGQRLGRRRAPAAAARRDCQRGSAGCDGNDDGGEGDQMTS